LTIKFAIDYTGHEAVNAILGKTTTTIMKTKKKNDKSKLTRNKYALWVLSSLQTALEGDILNTAKHSTCFSLHSHFCFKRKFNDEPPQQNKDTRREDQAITFLNASLNEQMERISFALNNLSYLKDKMKEIDDDGSHVKVVKESIHQLASEHYVHLFSMIFETTIQPTNDHPPKMEAISSTTSPFCRSLKEKFGSINDHMDQWNQHWLTWIVDAEIRHLIRALMTKVVNDIFVPFYNKYSVVQFSKKKMAQYTRWSPSKMVAKLNYEV